MLGHDLQAVLPELRAHAESRMGAVNGGSDAVVKRFTGGEVVDPFSGLYGPAFVVVHSGPMRLAAGNGPAASSRSVSVPGGEVSLAALRADFPVSTPRFADGDVIEVVGGDNAGTSWLVVEADASDQVTAYRVPVVAYSDE